MDVWLSKISNIYKLTMTSGQMDGRTDGATDRQKNEKMKTEKKLNFLAV